MKTSRGFISLAVLAVVVLAGAFSIIIWKNSAFLQNPSISNHCSELSEENCLKDKNCRPIYEYRQTNPCNGQFCPAVKYADEKVYKRCEELTPTTTPTPFFDNIPEELRCEKDSDCDINFCSGCKSMNKKYITPADKLCEVNCPQLPICLKGRCLTYIEKIQTECANYNGSWLQKYNECEGVTEVNCGKMGGVFDGCESACRHSYPPAEVCTQQCVQVCKLK